MKQLMIGVPELLVANEIYAVPTHGTIAGWQSPTGSMVTTSIDRVNYWPMDVGARPATAPNQVVIGTSLGLFILTSSSDTMVVVK